MSNKPEVVAPTNNTSQTNQTANGNQGVGGVSVLDEEALPWVASEDWDADNMRIK